MSLFKYAMLPAAQLKALQELYKAPSPHHAVVIFSDVADDYGDEMGNLSALVKGLTAYWRKNQKASSSPKLNEIVGALSQYAEQRDKEAEMEASNSSDDEARETVGKMKEAVAKIHKMYNLDLSPFFKTVFTSSHPRMYLLTTSLNGAIKYVLKGAPLELSDREKVRKILESPFGGMQQEGKDSPYTKNLEQIPGAPKIKQVKPSKNVIEKSKDRLPKNFEANMAKIEDLGLLNEIEVGLMKKYYVSRAVALYNDDPSFVSDISLEKRYMELSKGVDGLVVSPDLSEEEIDALKDAFADKLIDVNTYLNLLQDKNESYMGYLVYRLKDKEDRQLDTVRSKKSSRDLTGTFLQVGKGKNTDKRLTDRTPQQVLKDLNTYLSNNPNDIAQLQNQVEYLLTVLRNSNQMELGRNLTPMEKNTNEVRFAIQEWEQNNKKLIQNAQQKELQDLRTSIANFEALASLGFNFKSLPDWSGVTRAMRSQDTTLPGLSQAWGAFDTAARGVIRKMPMSQQQKAMKWLNSVTLRQVPPDDRNRTASSLPQELRRIAKLVRELFVELDD